MTHKQFCPSPDAQGIADLPARRTQKQVPGPPREYGMRIARDGIWFHQGRPIRRLPLVRLFASALQRREDGSYWLVTPYEHGVIEVEDAPFLAVELMHEPGVDPAGHGDIVRFRTNLDTMIICGPQHPLRVEIDSATQQPRPYVLVRDRLEARLTRAVFYELVDLAREGDVDGERVLGIWSMDRFFPLGPVEPEG